MSSNGFCTRISRSVALSLPRLAARTPKFATRTPKLPTGRASVGPRCFQDVSKRGQHAAMWVESSSRLGLRVRLVAPHIDKVASSRAVASRESTCSALPKSITFDYCRNGQPGDMGFYDAPFVVHYALRQHIPVVIVFAGALVVHSPSPCLRHMA